MASIVDTKANDTITVLLNVIEVLSSENATLRETAQNLKDENNRLKGEQGKPKIKGNKKSDGDISSDKERKNAETVGSKDLQQEAFKLSKNTLDKLKEQRIPQEILDKLKKLCKQSYSSKDEFIKAVELEIGEKLSCKYSSLLIKHALYKKRKGKSKVVDIPIDREVKCSVDKNQLPEDAKSKGHENKVVQDIIIKTDNIVFTRESYYSPSQNKTYLGEIPKGYEGGYGSNIKSQIVIFKYVNNMSIPKIGDFF
ncbi:MAG: hypothetical protein GY730_02195, partial [bacterium]|nr:hypothetical protein [bacterium]